MSSELTSSCCSQCSVLPLIVALVSGSVFAGCDGTKDPKGPGPDGQEYIETRVVTVGPTLARCCGVGLRTCMVVGGVPSRGEIVGFHPRHKYNYRLRVEKFSMVPVDMAGQPDGMTGSPMVPAYGYRWLETLEETLNQ